MAHNPGQRHTRNKTSLGSITYADLANTFNRHTGGPGPGPIVAHHQGNPHGVPQAAHMPPQYQDAQQRRAKLEREHYSRLSREPTDRELPDGVDDLVVVGDAVKRYRGLRDLERRLDAVMMHKRSEITDSVRHEKRFRIMRIWISNTSTVERDNADAPMEEAFDFGDEPAGGTYRMRIEGRLLPEDDEDKDDEDSDDSDDDDEQEEAPSEAPAEVPAEAPAESTAMDLDQRIVNPNNPNNPNTTPSKSAVKKSTQNLSDRRKFSHFFGKIVISFPPPPQALPSTVPPVPPIEWKKPDPLPNGKPNTTAPDGNFDALVFERKTDEPVQNVEITLHRDERFQRFRLSEPLARLLDREADDRASVNMAVWNYVRLNRLQEDGEPRRARCDEALRAVFEADHFDFVYMSHYLDKHLTPMEPITLHYTIRMGTQNQPATIYDVPLVVDDPLFLSNQQFASLSSPKNPAVLARLKQLHELDQKQALAVQGVVASKAKIGFLNQLSAEPVGFIRKWMTSQKADEEIVLGEEKGRGPEWSKGGNNGVWATDGAREGVALVLARGKPVGLN